MMSWKDLLIDMLRSRFQTRWSERTSALEDQGHRLSERERKIYRAAYQKAYWEGVIDALDVGFDHLHQVPNTSRVLINQEHPEA